MARHMFFGGNTPDGFIHHFDDILFADERSRMLYLKGASGSGKSTLMRRVGEAFERRGERVDYIHCSNNVEDLDGLCIRSRGIAMVDATAPHACDPLLPVAVGEIFNTADHLDRRVAAQADRLLALQAQKKPGYDKATAYLSAACTVLGNNAALYRAARDEAALQRRIRQELAPLEGRPIADRPGRNRRMFAAAVTPQGNVNFISTLVEGLQVVALLGCDGMGTDLLLQRLQSEANLRGLDTEGLYCPINPRRLDHLILPELGLCYTTCNSFHDAELPAERSIDFESLLARRSLREREGELSYNRALFEELQQRAVDTMAAQKELHDQIEAIYREAMDFDSLTGACDRLIEQLTG